MSPGLVHNNKVTCFLTQSSKVQTTSAQYVDIPTTTPIPPKHNAVGHLPAFVCILIYFLRLITHAPRNKMSISRLLLLISVPSTSEWVERLHFFLAFPKSTLSFNNERFSQKAACNRDVSRFDFYHFCVSCSLSKSFCTQMYGATIYCVQRQYLSTDC